MFSCAVFIAWHLMCEYSLYNISDLIMCNVYFELRLYNMKETTCTNLLLMYNLMTLFRSKGSC